MLANGYQLRAARSLAGLKQSELALVSGLSEITIATMEKKRDASLLGSSGDTLKRVEQALNNHGVHLINGPDGLGCVRKFP